MKLFLYALSLELRLFFRSKFNWLIFLVPVLCYALSQNTDPGEAVPSIPVGVVLPEGSDRAQELFELLRYDDGLIEFYKMDEAQLRQKVATAQLECGFILNEDFDDRLEKSRYNGLFTLIIGESSTLQQIVSEAVSAAMVSLVAQDIGLGFLAESGVVVGEEIFDIEASRFEIIPIFDGGDEQNSLRAEIAYSVTDGVFAVLLCIFAVVAGIAISHRRAQSSFKRALAVRGEFILILPQLCSTGIVLFTVSLLSYLALWEFELLPILCYVFTLMCFSYFISYLPRDFVVLLLPFFVILLLIATPIFFDIGDYSSVLGKISAILPSAQYVTTKNTGDYLGILFGGFSYVFCAYAIKHGIIR